MIIVQGEVYLERSDVEILKTEEEYVRKRYQAVARTLIDDDAVRIPRKRAAEILGRSKRQLQRVVKRFREEGIHGLRFRSKAPHSVPKNKTPEDIEERIVEVRKATGFGSDQLAAIVNESLNVENKERASNY
jgi:ribosome-binding protein aMBF1 (putative translation factor)